MDCRAGGWVCVLRRVVVCGGWRCCWVEAVLQGAVDDMRHVDRLGKAAGHVAPGGHGSATACLMYRRPDVLPA
jgi:hypothetical protein